MQKVNFLNTKCGALCTVVFLLVLAGVKERIPKL